MHASPKITNEPGYTYKYAVIGIICTGAVFLLAVHSLRWFGWLLLGVVAMALLARHASRFGKHMLILVAALVLLGTFPINTNISYGHMATMACMIVATVALPVVITRHALKEKIIRFPFKHGRTWYKKEVLYILLAGIASYLFLPFYLANTSSYLNWDAPLEPSYIARLFVGTNALAIWDEIFFVGVCLALLRRHIAFVWANTAQAVLWTAFLYELGFRGWGPLVIFFFAFSQGYIFKRSNSLLYIITVHLTIDLMLFLTLLHLHNPEYLRIFVTSPL